MFADVFRSDDISGWAKASWVFVTVFLPYLGVFGYQIARGGSMWKRNAREKSTWKQMNQGYVSEVPGGPSRAEELATLAELHDKGVLTTAEFDQQRALWWAETQRGDSAVTPPFRLPRDSPPGHTRYHLLIADSVHSSIDGLLAKARFSLERVDARGLSNEVAAGAVVVDIRPAEQRQRDGSLLGALIIDRNVLEWRLAPSSESRLLDLDWDQRVIVVCNEGYGSSLAAATLQELGLGRATDLIGGFQSLIAEGHPLVSGTAP